MRLTKKEISYTASGADIVEIPNIEYGYKYTGEAVCKLGQLEDIEEAMGVDLILYLKMCVIGTSVFVLDKTLNKVLELKYPKFIYNPDLKAFGFKALKDTYNWRFPMSEYGKTWALTEEELNK